MVPELVERRFAAGLQQRAVERLTGLQRQLRFEHRPMLRRQRSKPVNTTRSTRTGSPSSMLIVSLTDVWSSFSLTSIEVIRASG